MGEFDLYGCHIIELSSADCDTGEAVVKGGNSKGSKTRRQFSDMTRGQVILLLRQRGYTNWRFITDETT